MAAIAPARTTLGSGVTSSDEAGQRARPDRRPARPARAPQRRGRGEGEADDDRAVRPRHRGQVRQRRLPSSPRRARPSTADVSPTASPGISPAPGAGQAGGGGDEAACAARPRRPGVPAGGVSTATPRDANGRAPRGPRRPRRCALPCRGRPRGADVERRAGRRPGGGRARTTSHGAPSVESRADRDVAWRRRRTRSSPVGRCSTLPTTVASTDTARPPLERDSRARRRARAARGRRGMPRPRRRRERSRTITAERALRHVRARRQDRRRRRAATSDQSDRRQRPAAGGAAMPASVVAQAAAATGTTPRRRARSRCAAVPTLTPSRDRGGVSSILSPMPGTASRSSTLVNRPFASRHSMMRCGHRRPDARQRVELGGVRGVEVDPAVARRGRRRRPASAARADARARAAARRRSPDGRDSPPPHRRPARSRPRRRRRRRPVRPRRARTVRARPRRPRRGRRRMPRPRHPAPRRPRRS